MNSTYSAAPLADSKPDECYPLNTNSPYRSYASSGPADAYEAEIIKAPVPLIDHHRKTLKPDFIIVFVSFVLAIAAALGHHFFNRHLDGTPVRRLTDERFLDSSAEYLRKWSHGHSAALLVGNVLAQLVKLGLATAVGVAFVQRCVELSSLASLL